MDVSNVARLILGSRVILAALKTANVANAVNVDGRWADVSKMYGNSEVTQIPTRIGSELC